MFRVRVIMAVCAAALALGGVASAAGMADVVKTRQAALKALGAEFKALNDESRKGEPDLKRIRAAAAAMRKASGELPKWFPKGSGPEAGAPTKTKPAVWSDSAGFAQSARELGAEAAKLQTVAAGGDVDEIRAQAKTVGQTCGGCHAKFREK
ncbi:c-type cytochrome [Phenylobacterium sp. VNQ135]|uniref:c-type cytochrome n=1 Tax=Phenylobacterium sp. VNQ135 TaxID=3400922 RepID=UPI003C0A457B